MDAEDGARSLVTGALVFRWVWLVWMIVLAIASRNELIRADLVLISLSIAAVWTLVLTAKRRTLDGRFLVVDVAVCLFLVLASAFVVDEGEIVSGRPFFATGYPLSAALLWGALRGPVVGGAVAALLAAAHLSTRPLNGVPLDELDSGQVQNAVGAMLNYLVAGVAVGLVARLLWQSAEAVRRANAEAVREREHSARLAEREALGRAIHDSVLQALALVNKRGKELSRERSVSADEVAELARLAGDQEVQLRKLILREPAPRPKGTGSLREALEDVAGDLVAVETSVSSVGPLWLPSHVVAELSAAVAQALANVARHAETDRAAVFAEEDDGFVVISVRDDGVGFDYDESDLRVRGKVGILKSMKGRVEDLGGFMRVTTSPRQGTEIEFRVPIGEPG